MSKLVELREQIAALAKTQADTLEKYPEFDWPEDIGSQLKARNDEIAALSVDFKKLQANAEMAKAASEQNDHFNKPASQPRFSPSDDGKGGSRQQGYKSLGERFTEHPEWQDWIGKVAPNGFLSEKVRITSPQIQLGDALSRKAVVTGGSGTSGGALVFPDIQTGYIDLPFRKLTIRDLITNGTTNSDTVEYVRVTGYTSAAATVAEATSSTAGGVGVKPESSLAMEKVTAPVKTIAHWIPATKRALSDAAQLRTLIDAFLMIGLDLELENQIVNGNTVGEDFTGIANTPGTQSQAFDTDLLTTLRSAQTLVEVVGLDIPTAYLMHPNDWQTIDLLQDAELRYYMGGPRQVLTPFLWGLPVVRTVAVPAGTAYVANFKQCVLWDREQSGIQVSDSHSDFFVKNLVAILAELRAAFGVFRTKSIVEVALS